MNRYASTALLLTLVACDPAVLLVHDRGGCGDPGSTSTGSSTSSGPPSSSCPAFDDGVVEVGAREVLAHLGPDATGPIVVYLHGTYETPESVIATDSAVQALAAMVDAEGGALLLPRGREQPAAAYPWGFVEDPTSADSQQDAADVLEVAACAEAAGLGDRVVLAGFSAGAVAASYIAELRPLAGVVLWSGGQHPEDRPADLAGVTAVLAIHGGASDFGGYFAEAEASWTASAADAGAFALLCDHSLLGGGGHATAMASEGAEFARLASPGGHPYEAGWSGWTLEHACAEVTP